MIEMNVREENRIQVRDAEPVNSKLLAKSRKCGGRAWVNERSEFFEAQKSRGNRPRMAGPDEVERNHRCHKEEIVAQGFDEQTVRRVLRMVRIAEFKRKQAAPVLKVTSRAFGTGWRMPIVRGE